MALDYAIVKQLFADKLAHDSEGIGRFESAFFHTMKFVYLKGVEDGGLNTEALAQAMLDAGMSTGHGDTLQDLLTELSENIKIIN